MGYLAAITGHTTLSSGRIDYLVSGIFGAIGGALAYFYGDLTKLVICLFGFIAIDYLSGIICAITKKELSSRVGFLGLARKCHILIMVGIGNLIDITLGLDGITKSLVCCFYICNEGISILENAHSLGLPIPTKLITLLLSVKRGMNDDESEEEDEVDKEAHLLEAKIEEDENMKPKDIEPIENEEVEEDEDEEEV